mgnify:CR=1 FL=1
MEHKSTTLKNSSSGTVNQEKSKRKSIRLEINQPLITDRIAEAVIEHGGSTKGLGIKKCPGFQGFPLTRMSSIMDAFTNGESLPPIKVKQYRQSRYYIIVDGRHRFATNIIFKSTHVMCEVV